MGIIGAGGEAKYHLLAFSKIRPFAVAQVFCRTEQTRLFAARCKSGSLVRSSPYQARAAIEGSDVVLTATNSNVPVFDGAWLEPGMHITSIMGGNIGLVKAGIAQTKRRELDDLTIKRSDVIVVNPREQAIQDEQGDLFDPVRAGFLTWDRVGELGDLLIRRTERRRSDHALQKQRRARSGRCCDREQDLFIGPCQRDRHRVLAILSQAALLPLSFLRLP